MLNLDGLNLVIAIAVYDYLGLGSSYCGAFIRHTVIFNYSNLEEENDQVST